MPNYQGGTEGGCNFISFLLQFSILFPLTPPFKIITYIKILGELAFGSLHHFHVIHCVLRKYTWKAGILSVIDGVGHYIEKFLCSRRFSRIFADFPLPVNFRDSPKALETTTAMKRKSHAHFAVQGRVNHEVQTVN